MSDLSITLSPKTRKVLRLAAWTAIVLVTPALLPSLVEVLLRTTDGFTGLLPHPSPLWEVSPWSY